ncbi:Gamma-tubulin complex component 2, partial [Goodea atripinnis]
IKATIATTAIMSEFRIHHDVNELLSLLQVRGGDGAEGYIDLLQKHRTPYVTTTVSAHSAKVGHTPTHSEKNQTRL